MKKMATVQVTPDQDAVVSEIEIAAPPERVFQALVEREQALQWGSNEAFEIISWEMDPRRGGRWGFVARETKPSGAYAVTEFIHHGEILEFDPPRLLVYTWFTNFHEPPSHRTVVRWELTPIANAKGTRLKVTHSGLAPLAAARRGYSQGWPGLLQRIRDHFEK